MVTGMMKKNKIVDAIESKYCSGCGSCAQKCPQGCISMEKDEGGFLYPRIEETLCIHCGKCERACYLCQREHKFQNSLRKMAVYHINDDIRRSSSSGGVFYALAYNILRQGGIVFGASFDDCFQVHQTAIRSVEQLKVLQGSKYVQSNPEHTFAETEKELENGCMVLYAGTPCQIAGLKRFLGKEYDALFCVGIICHGAASPEVWSRYLTLKKGQFSEQRIKSINFRDKAYGWKNYGLRIEFGKHIYRKKFNEDIYMRGFLQNLYLRDSCYHCIAKEDRNSADLIIGDGWGIEQKHSEMNDDLGVSCIIICTEKGNRLWNNVQKEFVVKDIDYQEILDNNAMIEKSAPWNEEREKFFVELKETGLVEESICNHLHWDVIPQKEKYNIQYPVMLEYLRRKTNGKSISTGIVRLGWKNVALYAVTDLMDIIFSDMEKETAINVQYIVDRNFDTLKYSCEKRIRQKLAGIQQLVEGIVKDEIDGIVVCNPIRENDIIDDLLKVGIEPQKIVSAVSLIYA